jgi:phosphate:Na+ symporter
VLRKTYSVNKPVKRKFFAGIFLLSFCLFLQSSPIHSQTTPALVLEKPFSETIYNYSGDQQTQNIGLKTEKPIRVKVTTRIGVPVKSVPVFFDVLSTPKKGENFSLSESVVYTDSTGIAAVYATLGSAEGEYQVSAKVISESEDNLLVYRIYGRKTNWVIMLVIGLIGGLAMFLYGMEVMSHGLLRSAGDRLRSLLGSITKNRLVALGMGAFVTMIIQSSSATMVMLVSFVNSKLMKFKQTIPIMLGAAIGTTVTAQLIAFKLTDYSLLLLALGFFLLSFSKQEKYQHIGETLLGFGLLFFGMYIMSEAMYPLRSYEPFIQLLLQLKNPILGILVGTIFTALIQSSSAFVGIMIILGSQGLLSLEASIPMLFGSNIGTAMTALLASIKTDREARKVAVALTLFKFTGVMIFVWWILPFSEFIVAISPKSSTAGSSIAQMAEVLPRQIANAHTFYNIFAALIFLPITGLFARMIGRLIPEIEEKKEKPFETRYLDDNIIKTPSLALSLVKLEVIRMALLVRSMANDILPVFVDKKKEALDAIARKEKQVDFLRDATNDYLLKVTRENVREERISEAFQILYTIKELEQIADVISGTLSEKAHSWIKSEHEFSPEGKKDIAAYHEKIMKQIGRAIVVFRDVNLEKAKEMKAKYKEYRSISFELEKHHFERLKNSVEKSVQSSNTHLELLAMFRIVTGHCTNIARILIDWAEKEKQ